MPRWPWPQLPNQNIKYIGVLSILSEAPYRDDAPPQTNQNPTYARDMVTYSSATASLTNRSCDGHVRCRSRMWSRWRRQTVSAVSLVNTHIMDTRSLQIVGINSASHSRPARMWSGTESNVHFLCIKIKSYFRGLSMPFIHANLSTVSSHIHERCLLGKYIHAV